jgi:hypothetical protein
VYDHLETEASFIYRFTLSSFTNALGGDHEVIIIQHDKLTEDALQGLIEEFVTREGAYTGYTDCSLEENVEMIN